MDIDQIDYHLNLILEACRIMADGNKKAEELAREIREAEKDRKNPDKPAKGDTNG